MWVTSEFNTWQHGTDQRETSPSSLEVLFPIAAKLQREANQHFKNRLELSETQASMQITCYVSEQIGVFFTGKPGHRPWYDIPVCDKLTTPRNRDRHM